MPGISATPLVSIIVPTYNRAQWLPKAISSVDEQTCQDFEVIIIDDGSTDNTTEVAAGLESARTRLLTHENNRGAGVARNTGLKAANGQFIAFLDDDDQWLPDKLEKQLRKFDGAEPDVGVVYCASEVVSAVSGDSIHTFHAHSTEHKDIDFLRTITFSTSVPLIRKSCFDAIGLFDESLPGAQDKDLWIRIARRYRYAFIPDVLVRRFIHGQQITGDLQAKIVSKEKILEKYDALFAQYPDVKSHHLWRTGILYCLDDQPARGRRCFRRAIRQTPTRRQLYRDLLRSWLSPDKHKQRLLKESIGHVDGIPLYY